MGKFSRVSVTYYQAVRSFQFQSYGSERRFWGPTFPLQMCKRPGNTVEAPRNRVASRKEDWISRCSPSQSTDSGPAEAAEQHSSQMPNQYVSGVLNWAVKREYGHAGESREESHNCACSDR